MSRARPRAPRARRAAARPGRDPRGAGGRPAGRPAPHPLRPHGGVAVRLLARRRRRHGRRPRAVACHRPDACRPSATPTSPTSACSRRPSGGWSSTSTTSTRRCAPVGVGRQAARRQRRGRRHENGASAAAAAAAARARRAAYRRSMRGFAAQPTLDIWYAHLDVARPRAAQQASKRARPRPKVAGQDPRPQRAHRSSASSPSVAGGKLRFKSIPPLVIAAARPRRGRARQSRSREAHPARLRRVPQQPRARAPPAARPLPARRPGAQGRRRRQRRHALPHRALRRAQRGRRAGAAVQGGRRRRCSNPTPAAARTGISGARVVNGPAPGAGRERRVPRLEHAREDAPALLLAPAARHEGLGRDRDARRRSIRSTTWRRAPGASRTRTPAPATPSPSPPTWAAARFDQAMAAFAAAYADADEGRLEGAQAAIADGGLEAQPPAPARSSSPRSDPVRGGQDAVVLSQPHPGRSSAFAFAVFCGLFAAEKGLQRLLVHFVLGLLFNVIFAFVVCFLSLVLPEQVPEGDVVRAAAGGESPRPLRQRQRSDAGPRLRPLRPDRRPASPEGGPGRHGGCRSQANGWSFSDPPRPRFLNCARHPQLAMKR